MTIVEVNDVNYEILESLMQDYLAEMSHYYDIEIGDGRYSYKYLPYYLIEDDRHAFLINDEQGTIGFILLNRYSFNDEQIDWAIAEMYIKPSTRHSGYGLKIIKELKTQYPGHWQLKYSIHNKAAQQFWHKVMELYHGTERILDGEEMVVDLF